MDPVQVCNIALGHIGQLPIASFDEETTAAQLCAQRYAPLRDVVIEARDWTWAVQRFALDPNSTAPAWGYTRAYTLPENVITIRQACNAQGDVEYEREGRLVLCDNDGPLWVRCIVRVEDCDQFSPGFIHALTLLMAANLAGPLTENRQSAEAFLADYKRELMTAGSSDGLQGKVEQKTTISRLSGSRY
jgi:hypothetical protein